jgi:signal transduction histidine kinase
MRAVLTIAKLSANEVQLARLHGSELTAHSEGLGQGSEFVVQLPIAGD